MDENGETRRDRNQRFGVHRGPEVEVPDIGEHLWEWFWSLNACRMSGDTGPQPISHQEMQAWIALTGTLVRPEEISMLRDMDSAYRQEVARERQAAREASQSEAPKAKPRFGRR